MIAKFKEPHLRGLRLAGGQARRAASSAAAAAAASPPPSPAEIPFKNQQEVNDHLSSLCKRGLHREALRAFHNLRFRRTPPALFPSTYAHLVLACSAVKSVADGRQVHRHLVQAGNPPDLILHNHLLNMYGKCGAPDQARNLFDEMPERNLVSWTSLINGLSHNGREKEAAGLYPEMLRFGLIPDEFTLGSVLRSCAALLDGELGRQLHAHAVKFRGGAATSVQNALIFMYCKAGRVLNAAAVFSRTKHKDIISWGSMVGGYSQRGHELQALETFREMLAMGVGGDHLPNEFLFGSVFSACGALADLGRGEGIHALCLKLAFAGDACAGSAAADMYARCGDLAAAGKAFRQVLRPDAAAWNSIIAAHAYSCEVDEGINLFKEMASSEAKPDDLTIRCLLCNLAGGDHRHLLQGQLLHAHALKLGFLPDQQVCNTLLAMYSRCSGTISLVFHLFEEMKERDLVAWNTLLSACLQDNQLEEVLRLLNSLILYGHRPDQITFSIALAAASSLGYLEISCQLHARSIKSGWEEDGDAMNDLIDAYCKCGIPREAQRLLDQHGRRRRDVVAWSSLIVGYAQSGDAHSALQLFDEMLQREIAPNCVTLVGVLSACSRAGLVEEGRRIFETMERDYGVERTREHYSCMVDLLARAGWLSEAEELLRGMPFEPDAVAWKTLLAACRARGELGMAERAAGKILELDRGSSAALVLLCGVYASEGRWEEVARLRRTMRSRKVVKEPGKSWIKVNGAVRVFVVEDRTHPETRCIYSVLGALQREMSRRRAHPQAAVAAA